jgi:hypothetical protein
MREKAERENRAKFEAERRAREEADRANQIKFDAERQAREEAEQKAAMEAKAREVASRAAADQAEARQKAEREAEMRLAAERREAEARLSEERREAEQRFNAERAAREKAEEKARAEEEAEASQRAAQVARLKELSEQHERDLAAGIDPDAKKNRTYGKKKSGGLLRWLVVGAIALVVVGVGLIQVFPLGAVNTRFEKAFATWIHDDVTSTGMHVSLFPKPHVKLNQVALGKVLDAKAESGKLLMDIGDLFGERFTIDTLELTEVSVSYEALMRAAKWGAADRGNGIEISNIALRSAKLEVKGVAIDVFDADIKFSKDGKIVRASARAKDGKWSVDLTPAKSGAGEAADQWTVDFSGRNLNLPFGAPLPLTSVSAKGTMAGDALNFPQVEAKLLEGSASGSLKADWKNGINFTSEFAVEHVKVDQLTQVFTRDVSLGGKLDGQFTAAGSAATIGALLDAPVIQGSFVVKEGAIGNIDLVQAMRSPGSVGGQSKFAELTGQMRVSEGTVRYEKLKLSGGVLLANGNVNVNSANSTLSGVVNSEIRSNVAQDRANFIVTGKVSRPALKRG